MPLLTLRQEQCLQARALRVAFINTISFLNVTEKYNSQNRQGYRNWGASLVAQTVKRLPTMREGRPGFHPWVGKIPWRRKWQPTPVLLPGKSHGRRSLVGYSPRGRKESDTTERLHFHFHRDWDSSGMKIWVIYQVRNSDQLNFYFKSKDTWKVWR